MIYNFNGKKLKISDKEINESMKKYDLSQEEAIKLWLEDNDYIENSTVEEMTAQAKKNFKHYEKSDNERKKSATRERKVDEIKAFLLQILIESLSNVVSITGKKNEAEFAFTYQEEEYTVKLIKHRKSKA